jgi:hypothetical protein
MDHILNQKRHVKPELKSRVVAKIKQKIRENTSLPEGLKDKRLMPTEFKDRLNRIKEQEDKLYTLIFKEMENKVIM